MLEVVKVCRGLHRSGKWRKVRDILYALAVVPNLSAILQSREELRARSDSHGFSLKLIEGLYPAD
jgi:hypothetical protein